MMEEMGTHTFAGWCAQRVISMAEGSGIGALPDAEERFESSAEW